MRASISCAVALRGVVWLVVALCLLVPSAARGQSPSLQNGGFESAGLAPWTATTTAGVEASAAHGGAVGARLRSAGMLEQGWITVVPGRVYVLTTWFRWDAYGGTEWGYDTLEVKGFDWRTEASLTNLHARYERGRWHKLALAFTARTQAVRVGAGIYGPKQTVDFSFDDFALVEKTSNQAPGAAPTSNVPSGPAPLTATFQANADDVDGAVSAYRWDFGDGATDTTAAPTHVFRSRGPFTVRLTVWDNDGASASGTVVVDVSHATQPVLTLTVPGAAGSVTDTDAPTLVVSGTATAQAGRTIASVVWDQVDTPDAAALAISPAESLTWQTPPLRLRYGRNEILVTATDSAGAVSARALTVVRRLSRPVIRNITAPNTAVAVFEKFELRFDIDTVARHPLFAFDSAPPPGAEPGTGITAEALVTSPSGVQSRQPAFWRQEVVRTVDGAGPHYAELSSGQWVVRVAPQEPGTHAVTLRARDASGDAEVPWGAFQATAAVRPGFIRVSREDPRYFEFSNRQLFFPIGPASGPDYASFRGTGLNLERPWLAGLAAYSTNFARWMRVDKQMGNEGVDNPLSFDDHYPSHELSRALMAPGAHRIWTGLFMDNEFYPRFRPGSDYLVKLRLKTDGVTGPANPALPFGFVIKRHDFPTATIETDLLSRPSLITPIGLDREWHTVVARYRATSGEANLAYLSLSLENVTGGRAFIDEFSIREILADGSLGGEMVRHARGDLHTYVESRPAAYVDWQVEQGEASGVFFKFVVHDKRDWIQEHLTRAGAFQPAGDAYFQPKGSRARWLLEQWWRYLAARWGYSTAVHSWELCNEADPNDAAVYRMTQDFAAFMRQADAHPHLSTTSFWCCWSPQFWSDHERYPDVGYADLHEYTKESPLGLDETAWVLSLAQMVAPGGGTRPVIVGETGIGYPGHPYFRALEQSNPGLWYHNLLWAQLGASGLSVPNYWWSEHRSRIDVRAIARPFAAFMSALDLNRGGYRPLDADVSDGRLRALGQKHVANDAAHVWVQNAGHTWRNVMGVEGGSPPVSVSGNLTFTLRPSVVYTVRRWNTTSGLVDQTFALPSDAAGRLTLTVSDLTGDTAFLVVGPNTGTRPSAPLGLRLVRP